MKKILNGLIEHIKDKKLAEQCGLDLKNICLHEWQIVCFYGEAGKAAIRTRRCKKCGEHTSDILR